MKKLALYFLSLFFITLFSFDSQVAWATKRPHEIEEQKPVKKFKALSPIEEILENFHESMVVSFEDIAKISLEDLKEFNKNISPADNRFDAWINLILKRNKWETDEHFPNLFAQAKVRGEDEAAPPHAQYNLGLMYETGRGGLAQSKQEAIKWFSLAANQDYVAAQFSLGVMYINKWGTCEVENYEKIIDLFIKAMKKAPLTLSSQITTYLHRLIRPYSDRPFTLEEEQEVKQNIKILKLKIKNLLAEHEIEMNINKVDSCFKEKTIAINLLYAKYKATVDFEQECLNFIAFYKKAKPGFMIACLEVQSYDYTENLKSGSVIRIYSKDDLTFFCFDKDNIEAAKKLMFIINTKFESPLSDYKPHNHNRPNPGWQKSIWDLYNLNQKVADNYLKEALIQQDIARQRGAYEDNKEQQSKIEQFNSLLAKANKKIKAFEEVSQLPAALNYLLVAGRGLRNKKFLEEYPFLKSKLNFNPRSSSLSYIPPFPYQSNNDEFNL